MRRDDLSRLGHLKTIASPEPAHALVNRRACWKAQQLLQLVRAHAGLAGHLLQGHVAADTQVIQLIFMARWISRPFRSLSGGKASLPESQPSTGSTLTSAQRPVRSFLSWLLSWLIEVFCFAGLLSALAHARIQVFSCADGGLHLALG